MKEAISLAPYKTVVVDSNLFKYLEKYSGIYFNIFHTIFSYITSR
jgi:hypothetical protein